MILLWATQQSERSIPEQLDGKSWALKLGRCAISENERFVAALDKLELLLNTDNNPNLVSFFWAKNRTQYILNVVSKSLFYETSHEGLSLANQVYRFIARYLEELISEWSWLQAESWAGCRRWWRRRPTCRRRSPAWKQSRRQILPDCMNSKFLEKFARIKHNEGIVIWSEVGFVFP